MSKPIAVLISDVHYSLNTLELADAAFRQAIDTAHAMNVPLIDAGDLTNDKAILRAEVVNRLIETMKYAKSKSVLVYLLVGNHSLCNEKGEEHALEFLRPYVDTIIDRAPARHRGLDFIPYYSQSADTARALADLSKGATVIMHTGMMGAAMGHYVKDTSSLPPEAFADFRVISGHYHRAQDIKTGKLKKGAVGIFSYIGNPYTLTFGEAHDGPKGYAILHDNGLLERIPTNLRKHVIYDAPMDALADPQFMSHADPKDLIWVKLHGYRSELEGLKKEAIAARLGTPNFKLDKIYTDAPVLQEKADKMTGEEVLDSLIDSLPDSAQYKKTLKALWREIL